MSQGAALPALLGDADGQQFADQVWSRSAWSRKAGEGPDLTGLLTLEDVDELLAVRALRTPFVRVAKDGAVLDPARYTRGGGVGARVRDQVDGDRLVGLLADGCTVVLQGLHRAWAPLRAFSDTLAREVGHPIQVNAYLTPEGAQGFEAHYDTHDVFVVQTVGTKEWRVHAPAVSNPRSDDEWTRHREAVRAAAAGAPVLARTLEPGDVVYLPRGWVHSARANAGLSLHLTFGIHPYTRRDLADFLVAAALEAAPAAGADPLDESLPLGIAVSDARDLEDALSAVRANLVARLTDIDAAAVSTAFERRWAADARPDPLRPVRQLLDADDLGPAGDPAGDAELQARPGLSLRLEATPTGLVLVAGGRRLPFGTEHEQSLRIVASGATFRTGELVGLDPVVARRLVRELLLAGVVVVVVVSSTPA